MSDHRDGNTQRCARCLRSLAPHPGLGLLVHAETGIRQCDTDAAGGYVATPWLVLHGFKATTDPATSVRCSGFSASTSGAGRHLDWPDWISP